MAPQSFVIVQRPRMKLERCQLGMTIFQTTMAAKAIIIEDQTHLGDLNVAQVIQVHVLPVAT